MRVVLIIVTVLGLLMAGLAICGIRVANEHLAVDLDVQEALAGLHSAPLTLTDILATHQKASLDDIHLIRRAWVAVVFAGTTLFTVGIIGIIIQRGTRIQTAPAQPGAPPNGGPAGRLGDSRVGGGPPSVS